MERLADARPWTRRHPMRAVLLAVALPALAAGAVVIERAYGVSFPSVLVAAAVGFIAGKLL